MQQQPGTPEIDVLVVGCGAAGLSAAIEAADAGARVTVLESEEEPAGSTRLSAGYAVFCETDLEPGSRDELYADLLEAHHGDHDDTLSRLYVDAAPAAYVRLRELGVRFGSTYQFAHMHRPWGHEVEGAGVHGGFEIGRALLAAARARDIDVHTSTRARRLLRAGDGAAEGVVAETPAGQMEFTAKAVVLASGGFTRNPELIANFGPEEARAILPITGAGSKGDGLIMALSAGADTRYMCAGVAPTGPADPITGKGALVVYSGAILLNREGRRFTDESGLYNDISWAGLKQTDALMFQIYDSRMREMHRGSMLGRVLSEHHEYEFTALDDLLGAMQADGGLYAEAARGTIDAYNRCLANGETPPFGRMHLVGTSGQALPVAEPPFHGVISIPGTTHFNGGVRVDPDMRVIDVHRAAIPGLYAAGEIAGGFHGRGYLSGTHVGSALIFGQIAGRTARQALSGI